MIKMQVDYVLAKKIRDEAVVNNQSVGFVVHRCLESARLAQASSFQIVDTALPSRNVRQFDGLGVLECPAVFEEDVKRWGEARGVTEVLAFEDLLHLGLLYQKYESKRKVRCV